MNTIKNEKVFIMPGVLTAFVDKADTKHLQASAYFRYFAQNQYRLYTNDIALSQAFDWIYETITPSLAKRFLSSIMFGNINVISPEERDIKKAIKILEGSHNRELTFSDVLATVLAEKKGILQICTIDAFIPLFGLRIFRLPV